ncbi:striatin-like isoform X6 [Dermacentor silvarum]|nr:striatin-like isoform X3 [Dermacentor silvarum]XP_049526642.1 striatin-like isoform X5 [Dermacentor silvarum]XP_049526643.1 striatin-like isoform X6 [Dermacentor silvarum]
MEDVSSAPNHTGQLGPPGGPMGMNAKMNQEEPAQRPQYSIPGILHFIQHEWARFEMERAQWDVERAEFQARIAFLQGERKGQENLKNDLIRRIKMLEFALKQERIKSHKLKYDTDPNPAELKAPVFDDVNKEEPMDGELFITSNSNVSWRQGRQLLRQYLQEIGYTDTILDVRSARVRTLLGLGPAANAGSGNAPDDKAAHPAVNGGSAGGTAPGEPVKRSSDTQRRVPGKKMVNVAENALLDTEASVLATFDFLATETVDMEDDEDNFSDEMEDAVSADDEAEERMDNRRIKSKVLGSGDELGEADTENVLTEFDFLGPDSGEGGREGGRNQGDGSEWDGCAVDEEEEEEDEEEMAQRWGADPQLINQLVEEYRRERRGRKGVAAPVSSQRPKRSALQAMLASLSTPGSAAAMAAASAEEGGPGGNPAFSFATSSPPRIPAFSSPSAPPPAVPSSSSPTSASQNPSTSPPSATFGMPSSGDVVLNGQLGRQPIASRLASYTAFLEEADDVGPRRPLMGTPGVDEDNIDAALGLGELAGLTVNNEAESSYDISATKESFRKTWNAKYTLRSHFDGVRALAFHPVESVLITASEDHTLKLWNLQKTVPAKKTAALDVEPVYTFRAHSGPVLCLAMGATGEQCFSGGLDHTIRCWNVPSSTIDPYDSFEPGVLSGTLWGHTDAVWGLSMHATKLQLLSCSGDGTVRLWSPHSKVPLLHTYTAPDPADGIPTSVDFVRSDTSQMAVAYTTSRSVIMDLETGKQVVRLESDQNPDASALSKQINCVVSHPTLPMTVTAHEDRHIRFFDNNTGKMVHSMVAHLDAVTSLAIDPNGLYLLSGSHDCSIRLWNLDNKTCVQEITSHRKKFDESIFDVAFHPSKPYIASAGADALAKVFV